MNIVVAGCVAQAEGNEIIRRAPVVDVVVGPQSYHHLPQLLARAKTMAARWRPNSRSKTSSDFCPAVAAGDPRARHFILRHRAGRLRQVLHLLRGALYARRRSVAAGGKDRRRRDAARRQWRARNHADRPERQRLSRRRAGRTAMAARHGCCAISPKFPASCGCATPPAIPATSTTR
jgi:hypothetical protein